jgi:TrmH family RNA methyltransferase
MPRILPVSSENVAFQRLEVLGRNRKKRRRYGQFVVEGVRPIDLALANGWTVDTFAYTRERELSRWASGILETSTARTHLELTSPLMAKLSERDETSELIAVIDMRDYDPARIRAHDAMLVVVIDRPNYPGNLGTLIRSCDAFGADGVIVTGHGADLYDPQTVRASIGTIFRVPSIALPSHAEVLAWIDAIRPSAPGVRLVGSSAAGGVPLRSADLGGPIVLVAGNETAGLSHAWREACDAIVTIPMRGVATSLNLAEAVTVMLYEIDGRRT